MKFYCVELDLYLIVEESLIVELVEEGRKYYPKEYGGILVGRYSDDRKTCHVERTILPIEYRSSKYLFERGRTGVVEELTIYYNSKPRLIYIGEWHTHPNSVPIPSGTDKQAMKILAEDEQVTAAYPILMIIGVTKASYSICFYVQNNNKLSKYEQQD